MSGDINFFVVDGYVGADPQINIAPDEKATRARFRIATSRKFQKESGDVVEYTEWFSVVCWGASYVEKVIQPYVTKGSFVQVMGRVQNTRWTDQDGIERFGVEVVADRIDLLDKAGAVEALDADGSGTDAMLASETSKGHVTDIDDEIPF
ncbi:MAG: single-stranded DNA-binding protein [Pseudomonadota bacterium]